MSRALATLGQWMTRVQVWVLTWIAAHIVGPAPIVYHRPGGPALWRATYWWNAGLYTVQFYRDGECVAAGTDPLLRRAYQRARRTARAVLATEIWPSRARARFDTGGTP